MNNEIDLSYFFSVFSKKHFSKLGFLRTIMLYDSLICDQISYNNNGFIVVGYSDKFSNCPFILYRHFTNGGGLSVNFSS